MIGYYTLTFKTQRTASLSIGQSSDSIRDALKSLNLGYVDVILHTNNLSTYAYDLVFHEQEGIPVLLIDETNLSGGSTRTRILECASETKSKINDSKVLVLIGNVRNLNIAVGKLIFSPSKNSNIINTGLTMIHIEISDEESACNNFLTDQKDRWLKSADIAIKIAAVNDPPVIHFPFSSNMSVTDLYPGVRHNFLIIEEDSEYVFSEYSVSDEDYLGTSNAFFKNTQKK